MGSIRRIIGSTALLVLGLVVAVSTIEIIVRIFVAEPILPRFVIDSGFGIRMNQPNVETHHYVPGDYGVKVTTNSAGMRGFREYPVSKASDVCRVAVIGDSYVFGFGVNDEEVVSAVLEDQLNEVASNNGCRYEVINFSVSGFGQAEELVTYRELIRNYKPDVVVLFYYSNDVGNNAVSKLFEVDSNGKLRRTENEYLPGVKVREVLYGIAPVRWLFTHSQAWNFLRNRLSQLVQKSLLKKEGLKTFQEPKPEAVELTRMLLLEFIADIRNDGARAAMFVIPGKGMGTNFPLSPEEVMEAGAYYIDGRNFLLTEDYYVNDDHWRASGHRKAAKELARFTLEMQ